MKRICKKDFEFEIQCENVLLFAIESDTISARKVPMTGW